MDPEKKIQNNIHSIIAVMFNIHIHSPPRKDRKWQLLVACFYFLPYSFWYFLNFFVVRNNVFWIIWPFLVLFSTPGQLVYVILSASWDHQSHYHQAQILRLVHSAGVPSTDEIAVKLDLGARRVLGMREEGNESLNFSFFCMDNPHTCTWTGRHGQTNARIRQEQIGDNGDLVLW